MTSKSILLSVDTYNNIQKILEDINKKNYGRKIKPCDIVTKSISLLAENHFQELRDASLSNSDRIEQQYQLYCEKNGFIKKDEYLGLLMACCKIPT